MNKDIEKETIKALISGDTEQIKEVIADIPKEEQASAISSVLVSIFPKLAKDPMFENLKGNGTTYNKAMKPYLAALALKKAQEENKNVNIVYGDLSNLGIVNSQKGPEEGNKILEEFVKNVNKSFNAMGFKENDKNKNLPPNEIDTYSLVRLGGDEFIIITTGGDEIVNGKELNAIDAAVGEALTGIRSKPKMVCKIDNQTTIEFMVNAVFGRSKLDNLDQLNNTIKNAENDALANAYISNEILIEKEALKKWKMKEFLRNIQNVYKTSRENNVEQICQLIEAASNDNSQDVQTKKGSEIEYIPYDEINPLFWTLISGINGRKEDNIKNLIDLTENNPDTLTNLLLEVRDKFVFERENIITKAAQSLVLDSLNEENLEMTYVELDNLKLVNTAQGHSGGDAYIDEFLNIIETAVSDVIPKNEIECNLRVAGNGIVVMCKPEYSAKIMGVIKEKQDEYNKNQVAEEFGIPMDIYFAKLDSAKIDSVKLESNGFNDEITRAGEDIKKVKNNANKDVLKLISSNEGISIFYGRQVFKLDEIDEYLKQEIEDTLTAEEIDEINKIMQDNDIDKYLSGIFEEDGNSNKYDLILQYVTWCEVKTTIDVFVENATIDEVAQADVAEEAQVEQEDVASL